MSIWKNDNEAAFKDGKKHFTDVIKNSGPGDLMIWRQPEEDFNTNSTLIVNPGEEAVFINGGRIEQVFQNGTYKLSTSNYPFISRLRNAFSGGVSVFNCIVYFVRKADSREIRWGSASPIQVRDKVWGIRTDARARGAYKVRIEDAGLFLTRLVGNNMAPQTQEQLDDYFRSEFQGRIRTAVSTFLNSLDRELIGIDEYLDVLSDNVQPYIDSALSEYGLKCVKFTLSGLDVDTSKYDKIDSAQIESISKVKLAQGEKGAIDVLGSDWNRVKAVDILGKIASNEGAGNLGALGASLGLGASAGSALGGMAGEIFGSAGSGAKAAEKPAEKPADGKEDPVAVLSKLKELLNLGLIEEEEYNRKKSEVLSRM